MENSKVFKKNPKIVTRKIEGETILLPLYNTSEEIDCIYTLNDVADRIWELIDGKKKLGEIKKILLNEFDISEKELEEKLINNLKDLKEIKAID